MGVLGKAMRLGMGFCSGKDVVGGTSKLRQGRTVRPDKNDSRHLLTSQ
jgi:hypothetical protein